MVWDIDPVLVDLGIVQIRYYGLCWVIGLFLGLWMAKKAPIVQGIPEKKIDQIFLILVISVMIFAHLVHLIFYEPSSFWRNPRRIIEVGSGLASHGGILGLILAIWWFAWNENLSFLALADVVAYSGAYTGVFIRLGNFFNSEIIGDPTDLPWGIVFAQVSSEPRHPTQLYEALALLIIALLTTRFYFRYHKIGQWDGLIFAIFLLSYFSIRIVVEFVKVYMSELESGDGYTMGQILSIPYIIVSIVVLYRIFKKNKKEVVQ